MKRIRTQQTVMEIYEMPQIRSKLNEFAVDQWERTLAFLQGNYSLSLSDCEDVFQEAFVVLYKKIKDDKLTLTSSLSTYFLGICKNKVMEKLRANGKKELNIIDEFPQTAKAEFDDDRIDRILALENDTEEVGEKKNEIVRHIVSHLPSPCNAILWGFYRDGFSMKALAQTYKYSSEGTVKVIKHRCCEKFRARFLEMSKHIYD